MWKVSYSLNREDILLGRVLPGDTGFYLDVGAADPVEHSVTKLFYDRGWSGINVEPQADFYARLQAERPRDTNLRVVLSDRPGSLTLFAAPSHPGWATANESVAAQMTQQGIEVVRHQIRATTLADVCAEHVRGTIDFLKIDVEGEERNVLLGADFRACRPRVVVVEATEQGSTVLNHHLWEDILLAADYRYATFDGLNRYYVRAEDETLIPALRVPVNVFDEFAPYEYQRQIWAFEARQTAADELREEYDRARVAITTLTEEREAARRQLDAVRARLRPVAEAYAAQPAPRWPSRGAPVAAVVPPPDPYQMIHRLRTEQLRRMPRGAETVLSGGASGGWYFDWFQDNYPGVRRHIGVEAYLPQPPNLPANVEWVTDYLGNMHHVASAGVDLVYAGQTVEHVWPDDLANFLCESHRVLRPGGWIVYDSPNRRITSSLKWYFGQHTAELTVDEAVRIAQLAGFGEVRVRGIWLCYQREEHRYLPFDPAAPVEGITHEERIALADGRPEDSFIWWLEARKTGPTPDRGRVTEYAHGIYNEAFPGHQKREYSLVGRTAGWGRNRFVASRQGEPGHVMYGPYIPLRPGSYRVVFGVGLPTSGWTPVAGNPVVAEIDCCNEDGAEVYARRLIRLSEVTPGRMTDFGIALDLTEVKFGIQLRAATHGAVPLVFRNPPDLIDEQLLGSALGTTPFER